MKPTSPLEVELVFLHDVQDRLKPIHNAAVHGRPNLPAVLGLQSVINNRLAEVSQQHNKEIANANQKDQRP